MIRRPTRNFKVGTVPVGSVHPVTVQSMCNTPTADAAATLEQIRSLASLGCEIIRVSVDNPADVGGLREICSNSPIPVVADIQFAAEMAVAAMDAGCHAVRLNPGIVRNMETLEPVAAKALQRNVPVRVGANAGSLPRYEIEKRIAAGMNHDDAVAEALCSAALTQCDALEKCGVRNIKVALKCSSVPVTLKACRKFAGMTDYPMHLGLTEAGTPARGVVKSAAVLGALLLDGIGDTIRISLTGKPEDEVLAAQRILESCGVREAAPEIVSCPTCGRTEIDLIALAEHVEKVVCELKAAGRKIPHRKIAVMGCPVNGPGEARDADLGIAGTRTGQLIIFRGGQVVLSCGYEEGLARFTEMLLG